MPVFGEGAAHFVRCIEEDGLDLSCRSAVPQLKAPYRRLEALGSPASRGLPSSRFESETWEKETMGSMHVDENGEETALTCTSEWVLNQR